MSVGSILSSALEAEGTNSIERTSTARGIAYHTCYNFSHFSSYMYFKPRYQFPAIGDCNYMHLSCSLFIERCRRKTSRGSNTVAEETMERDEIPKFAETMKSLRRNSRLECFTIPCRWPQPSQLPSWHALTYYLIKEPFSRNLNARMFHRSRRNLTI